MRRTAWTAMLACLVAVWTVPLGGAAHARGAGYGDTLPQGQAHAEADDELAAPAPPRPKTKAKTKMKPPAKAKPQGGHAAKGRRRGALSGDGGPGPAAPDIGGDAGAPASATAPSVLPPIFQRFLVASIAVVLATLLLMTISIAKVYAKAGRSGFACLLPIYNLVVLLEIAGRPLWWLILLCIPYANLLVMLVVHIDLARAFGKGAAFGVGLQLLPIVFYPVLAFGDAEFGTAGAPPPPRRAGRPRRAA